MPTYRTDLLSVSADAKTWKGQGLGYLTGILYLAPHTLSGFNVCSHASPGCSAVCIYYSGRGTTKAVQEARLRRTEIFFQDRKKFLTLLRADIFRLEGWAKAQGRTPTVRLNGTSDLPWERIDIDLFNEFPHIQFYDYTKVPGRRTLPKNYHLTFSYSETNLQDTKVEWAHGRNVAVVTDGSIKPWTQVDVPWYHEPVPTVDGEQHDCRFLDPKGSVVLLKSKGKGYQDRAGFIHRQVIQ